MYCTCTSDKRMGNSWTKLLRSPRSTLTLHARCTIQRPTPGYPANNLLHATWKIGYSETDLQYVVQYVFSVQKLARVLLDETESVHFFSRALRDETESVLICKTYTMYWNGISTFPSIGYCLLNLLQYINLNGCCVLKNKTVELPKHILVDVKYPVLFWSCVLTTVYGPSTYCEWGTGYWIVFSTFLRMGTGD